MDTIVVLALLKSSLLCSQIVAPIVFRHIHAHIWRQPFIFPKVVLGHEKALDYSVWQLPYSHLHWMDEIMAWFLENRKLWENLEADCPNQLHQYIWFGTLISRCVWLCYVGALDHKTPKRNLSRTISCSIYCMSNTIVCHQKKMKTREEGTPCQLIM